jgi:hypothetical protein
MVDRRAVRPDERAVPALDKSILVLADPVTCPTVRMRAGRSHRNLVTVWGTRPRSCGKRSAASGSEIRDPSNDKRSEA